MTQRLGISNNVSGSPNSGGMTSLRNSKLAPDLAVLDKLVTSILERHQQQQNSPASRLHRLRSLTRSRNTSMKRSSVGSGNGQSASSAMPTIMETNNGNNRPSNSWSERSIQNMHVPGVRQILNTLTNAPHSFSHTNNRSEESANMLD